MLGIIDVILSGVLVLWLVDFVKGVWGTIKATAAGFCWAVYTVTSGSYILSMGNNYKKFLLKEADYSYILTPIF